VKPAGIVGILLIVIGVVALAWGGFASFSTKENVAKLGPLEINKESEHRVPVGPIAGGACLVGGIILVIAGSRGGTSV
jgi:drug/metabolite transporter (DMT)-like permease